jgi:LacI family transcriptional regulator
MKSGRAPDRPHVALLVETSLASGRDILRGIARYGREHGPWSLYHEPRSLSESLPRWLARWRGDGIIARIQNDRIAREVAAAGLPVVDVLGVVPGAGFPLVHVDDGAIGRLAAGHLLERGFRRFGVFGFAGENWSERRRDAFVRTVRAEGFDAAIMDLPRAGAGGPPWEEVEDRLSLWVKGLPRPAGVLVCSDQRGPMILEACRRAGVRVPDEVAVVGVDDDEPLCEVANPPLSSVRPGHDRVGYEAAELLARLMAGARRPARPRLVEPVGVTTRLSTDVLAIEDRSLAAALRFIRDRGCEGIGVDEVARQAFVSRSVLQRRFRALLKRTVHGEILRVRVNRALELLTRTALPLDEVAERAGFNHQEYMGAVFKRRFRKTPARIRRESRPAAP